MVRERMAGDPHRPRYHYLPPANWMNDPNGLVQWQGRYHLFYQHNPNAAVWGPMHWGHAASDDLTHWTDWPIALAPTPGGPDQDGCWSGCAVDDWGVPRLIYTGRSGASESVCVATSQDGLLTWQKDAHNPVIPGPPPALQTTAFRDPYVWREGASWRMAIGSGLAGQGGAVVLYESPNLRDWRYLGPLLVGEAARHGLTWECPNFLPLGNSHVLIVSAMEPGRVLYFVGEYTGHQFHTQREGILDGRCFYAPQVMMDQHGRPVMFGWLKEGRNEEAQRAAGWSGVQSLPRILSLAPDGRLMISPAPELTALRGESTRVDEIVLSPGAGAERAAPVSGDCLEIEAEFDPPAGVCGLKVRSAPDASEEMVITYDPAAQTVALGGAQAAASDWGILQAQLHLGRDEPLTLRLFLDRSVVEVFVNDGACLTGRVYPARADSLGVWCFARNRSVRLRSMTMWPMRPIW